MEKLGRYQTLTVTTNIQMAKNLDSDKKLANENKLSQ
jgi:hypothetical protein